MPRDSPWCGRSLAGIPFASSKSVAETPRTSRRGSLVQGFHNHRNALAATDASGCQAVAEIVAAQLVENGDDQACSGGAKWMPKCDGPAVHVGFVAIETQNLFNRQILRGKSFVDLDAVHLFERQPPKLQGLLRRGHRANAHDAGVDASDSPGNDAANGFQA